jgi:hypothetical protein
MGQILNNKFPFPQCRQARLYKDEPTKDLYEFIRDDGRRFGARGFVRL